MRHLKLSFIELLVALAIFFGVKLLYFNQTKIVDIHTFVYFWAVAAIAAIIVFPVFIRYPLFYSLVLWTVGYLLLRVALLEDEPLIKGIYAYITITEIGFGLVLVALAYQVGRGLQEFVKSVEFVTLSGGDSKIPHLEEAEDLIDAEMNRSRHYNRSLSIILASLDPQEIQHAYPRLFLEAQEKVMQSYVTARLAQTIRGELRRMDMVIADQDNGRVIVISPEVDDQGSGVVLERVSNAVYHQLGVKVKCGSASYPQMALTFEDLVHEAEAGMGRNVVLQLSDNSGVAD